ncbi:MAG: RNA-binding S4 domain-containing protein [Rhodobacteraceae bacterium]|nr:RNA-binding S4 domain-containing protein [Paracoccaceae bacterium]MBT6271052.1 RNA-binding S4 domain-containing protein [Paracoccaceae bacterium]
MDKVRADKWLWFARFFRTRSLSSKYISENSVRVNGTKTKKPSASVKPGDIITLTVGNTTKVVKILSCGVRRGSALDASLLYSLQYSSFLTENKNYDRVGARPTKKNRRILDKIKSSLE